jgi:hypothetical protein
MILKSFESRTYPTACAALSVFFVVDEEEEETKTNAFHIKRRKERKEKDFASLHSLDEVIVMASGDH